MREGKRAAEGRDGNPFASHVVQTSKLARCDPVLAGQVDQGIVEHVLPKTRSSYRSAKDSYVRFCEVRLLRAWPAKDVNVAGWLHTLATTVAVGSMGMYLSGIKYFHEMRGDKCRWQLDGSEVIRRTLRFLKRRYPVKERAAKLPISLQLLSSILPLLPGWPILMDMSPDDRVFTTASVIGVSGFLRGGEFLVSPGSDRPTLRMRDVQVKSIGSSFAVVIEVPQPKAKFWVEAQSVSCHQMVDGRDDAMCPVRLWEGYVKLLPHAKNEAGPAFITASGKPLSRAFMVGRMESLIQKANIALVDAAGRAMSVRASSWRAGGVRSALDARVPTPIIMAAGRWRSTAWMKYFVEYGYDLRRAAENIWASVPSLDQKIDESPRKHVVEIVDMNTISSEVLEEDQELASSVCSMNISV